MAGGASETPRIPREDIKAYLTRARENAREMGSQIEAFSARIARRQPQKPDPELMLALEELRAQNESLRQAHALLERERGKYVDLFERAPDAYVTTDARGVIREANPAAAGLLGMPREALLGRLLIGFVARRDTQAFRDRLRELRDHDAVESLVLKLRARGGGPFTASLSVRSVMGTVRWSIRPQQEGREVRSEQEGALLELVQASLRDCVDQPDASRALDLMDDLGQLAQGAQPGPQFVTTPLDLARLVTKRAGGSFDVRSLEDGASIVLSVERACWAIARVLGLLGHGRIDGWHRAKHYVFQLRAADLDALPGSALTHAAVREALRADGCGLRVADKAAHPGGLSIEISVPVLREDDE